MAIISFDKDVLIDYIPAYNGNRESTDPCIIKLHYVPYSKIQHYARLIAARTKGVIDQTKIHEIMQEVQKKQFVENVDSISNFYVSTRAILEPSEFFEYADQELIFEIIKAMESIAKLTEGQKKIS